MARRRAPVQFEELQPKGRGSILRSREEVLAEQEATGDPGIRESGKPDSVVNSGVTVDRSTFLKATYRLCPEASEAIDEIKRQLRQHLKRRVTYEEIAEAALVGALENLTENRESSFLVRWLSGNPEIRKSGQSGEATM